MKKGTGDDPFAETPEENPAHDAEEDNETGRMEDNVADEQAKVTTVSTETQQSGDHDPSATPARSTDDLPYLLRRQLKNESVKADRNQVPFFLRAEVQHEERDFRHNVEDSLDQEVNKTDLREAAYVFAQRHPESVADILREWGIEYLE